MNFTILCRTSKPCQGSCTGNPCTPRDRLRCPSRGYCLDGAPLATHREPYYPEERMSINFNLWFIREGPIASRERRVYTEDVDWVFHSAGSVLQPGEVERQVNALRTAGVSFRDTVPAIQPPLSSPCDF